MIIEKININLYKHNNTGLVTANVVYIAYLPNVNKNASTDFDIINNDPYSEFKKYPFSL